MEHQSPVFDGDHVPLCSSKAIRDCMIQRKKRPTLVLAIAMCSCGFATSGCNSRPPTYPVSGKVIWKGGAPATELNGGFVTLDSVELMVSAVGPIGPDGSFKLGTFEESDGVP